ncbi:hypothetical protein C8R43DRAFT_964268 [Mycena crocata]|nr:hypothetical protein C8R43DRAFT_964268 [Mycena crocata]
MSDEDGDKSSIQVLCWRHLCQLEWTRATVNLKLDQKRHRSFKITTYHLTKNGVDAPGRSPRIKNAAFPNPDTSRLVKLHINRMGYIDQLKRGYYSHTAAWFIVIEFQPHNYQECLNISQFENAQPSEGQYWLEFISLTPRYYSMYHRPDTKTFDIGCTVHHVRREDSPGVSESATLFQKKISPSGCVGKLGMNGKPLPSYTFRRVLVCKVKFSVTATLASRTEKK